MNLSEWILVGTVFWLIWFFVGISIRLFVFDNLNSTDNELVFFLRANFWPFSLAKLALVPFARRAALLWETVAGGVLFLVGHVFVSVPEGVSLMKRKLFSTVLLLFLGAYAPNLYEQAVSWWNAPPAPPSPEAQRLIASLESGEGWKIGSSSGRSCVVRGDVVVFPCSFPYRAEINASLSDVSGTFSSSERIAVNAAAEKCLRKLTARALETVEK